MTRGTCGACQASVDPKAEACPECGADLAEGDRLLAGLSDEEEALAERGRSVGLRLGAAAAVAIGLGLILIGVGNGVWRLTGLGELAGPGGALGLIFHLVSAAILVGVGTSLLPIGLHLGEEERVPIEQGVALFASLWLVVGLVVLLAELGDPGSVGGGLVVFLSGVFGLVATTSYDADRRGSALSSGVMGLVAGGLLIGGVATLPVSLTQARRFGAELVFRYADPVQVSGYLIAVLAVSLYPFVRRERLGRAASLLGAAVGGIVWGLGELVFGVQWLAEGPWSLFSTLDAGASAGYGFVLAGGLLTVLGGLAALGAWVAAATYAGVPLASAIPSAQREPARSTSQRTCSACGSTVTTSAEFCPGCGNELADAIECRECGEPMAADAGYCPSCGEEVVPEAPEAAG